MKDMTRLTALINGFLKNIEQVSAELKTSEQDTPENMNAPILPGIRIEYNQGNIDDGATTYNTSGKPMSDWLRDQQDDGWKPI